MGDTGHDAVVPAPVGIDDPGGDDALGEAGVPWQARLPGGLLAAVIVMLWVVHVPGGGMTGWAVSAAALHAGRWGTTVLHMFAHGSLLHVGMNAYALYVLGGPLVTRLGTPPGAWLRYAALFVLGGGAGATLFLALRPSGAVPMLGASGAIYAQLGLILRLRAGGGALVPLRSRRMWRAMIGIVKDNIWLFVLFGLPPLLAGTAGGLAWEAHLGGLVFGLVAGPRFLVEPVAIVRRSAETSG